jgi:ribosomal RNA-processing protein 12
MGKGRVRVKGAKGKRWRRGQSGVSNPSEASHRLAARGRFGDHLYRGRSSALLTADALARLHASQEEEEELGSRGEEEVSGSSRGASSAAASSALTLIETAHPVFGPVRKLWNSPTESHRVICAVLAAVSEVVKSGDGRDTETEYFGALMTVLESCRDEKSAAAICYLLCLLLPSLPREVLQVKYSTSCRILTDQLALHEANSSTALLKSLVRALALLLQAQPRAVWTDSHCQKVFQTILNFTVHPKPKLRKAAQAGVVAILREGSPSGEAHAAAPPTARHCRHVLGQRGPETARLHVLGLLRESLANFPTQHVKTLCEAILRAMELGSSLVRTSCLHALHGAMASVAGPQGLTLPLTARIIAALYDREPGLEDWQLLRAWLAVLQAAHARLASLDRELCVGHLARLFSVSVGCLLSRRAEVSQTAATAMQTLLADVVGPYAASLDANAGAQLQPVREMYTAVVRGLDFKYQSSWGHVLQTLTIFHRVAGENCHSVMAELLPSLCSLHSLPDFKLSAELGEAVGAAIATMGPQTVLDHVPLDLDSEESYPPSLPRSWLLPVLRDHVRRACLAYFRDHLLPLAGRMRARAESYQEAGKRLAAKLYSTLYHQVWSLLPGFCREPRDVQASFPGLARILGTALATWPELRPTIAASLHQLVESSREKEGDRAVISHFSKNYLPILFNLYTSEEGEGQAVLRCVEAYVSISPPALTSSLASAALARVAQPDLSQRKRHRLLDLVAAMATYLPLPPLQALLAKVAPLLDSGDATLQKKSYKVLERVLSSKDPAHKSFVEHQLERRPLPSQTPSPQPALPPRSRGCAASCSWWTTLDQTLLTSSPLSLLR